jgi:hypothetical protein
MKPVQDEVLFWYLTNPPDGGDRRRRYIQPMTATSPVIEGKKGREDAAKAKNAAGSGRRKRGCIYEANADSSPHRA